MAIDMLSSRISGMQQEGVGKTAGKGSVPAKGSNVSAAALRAGADAVLLTDSGQTLSRATAKAKAAEGVDYNRIEKLKQSIKDGSYQIDYEKVASKLIDSEDEISSIFG